MTPLSITFTTDLGAHVTVTVESADKLLDVQRQYGRLGWTSGEIPAGGYQFPFENAHDFDWALIGARKWTNPEGEELVMHRGHAYKIRELEAVDNRKMQLPAIVKISRGAKTNDPEHIREKGDGDIEYVTLAVFKGGKRQERYAEPRQQQTRPATTTPSRDEDQQTQQNTTRKFAPDEPIGSERAKKMHAYLGALLKGTEYAGTAGAEKLIELAIKAPCPRHWADLTDEQARAINTFLNEHGFVLQERAS